MSGGIFTGGTARTALALAGAQIATGLSLALVARRVGIEDFGSWAVGYSVSIGAGALLDFGSGQKMTKLLATSTSNETYTNWLVSRSALHCAAASIALAIGLMCGLNGLYAPFVIQSFTYALSLGILPLVRVRRSVAQATTLTLLGNVTMLLMIALLLPARGDGSIAAWIAAASWLVTASTAVVVARGSMVLPGRLSIVNPWATGSAFGVSATLVLMQSLDIVVLRIGGSERSVAVYASVSRWVAPLLLIVSALSQNLFPRLVQHRSPQAALREVVDERRWVVLALSGCAGLYVFAPIMVDLLLGSEYADATTVVRGLALAAVPICITQPMFVYLQAIGKERQAAIVLAAIVTIHLGATWVLSGRWGPLAPVIGIAAAQIVGLAATLRLVTSSLQKHSAASTKACGDL